MAKRLNIGLMISHLEDDFASAVCRGAIVGAKEIDANLIIFPGRYIDAVYVDKNAPSTNISTILFFIRFSRRYRRAPRPYRNYRQRYVL